MATDIAKLNITIDSTDATDAASDLDRLGTSADKAGAKVDGLGSKTRPAAKNISNTGTAAKKAGGNMGGFGRSAGQAGIQVQQLVGQIQGGQSAMLALSQQSADLGIVLGAPMIGVLVSFGATIAGMIVSSLNKAKDSITDLLPEADTLRDKLKELSEEQAKYLALINAREQDEAQKRIKDLNKALVDESNLLFEIQQKIAFAEKQGWEDRIVTQTAKLKEQQERLQGIRAAIDTETQSIKSLGEQIDIVNGKPTVSRDWWGDDASANAAAFQIRMQLAKQEQAEKDQLLIDGQQFGRDMFQRDLQEKEFARQASNQAELEAELAHRNAMTEIYSRAEMQKTYFGAAAVQERIDAEILAEKNKTTIKQNLASMFTTFMRSESKALFEIGKIGAAGKAANDAYGAINATLAQGGAFAVPAAVAIGSAAFANVGSILSSKFGSPQRNASSIPDAPTQQVDNSVNQSINNTFNIAEGSGGSSGIIQKIQEAFDSGALEIRGGSVVSV